MFLRRHPLRLLSLLAILIPSFLWFATNDRTWLISWARHGDFFAIRSDVGRLCFEKLQIDGVATPRQGQWDYTFSDGTPGEGIGLIPEGRSIRNGYGFTSMDFRFTDAGHPVRFRRLTVPFWPLILLLFIAPAVALRRALWRRRQAARLAAGLCSACGYDIRATPNRCPECGTPSSGELLAMHDHF